MHWISPNNQLNCFQTTTHNQLPPQWANAGGQMMVLSQLPEELQKCYLHQKGVEFNFQFNGDVKYPGADLQPETAEF